MNNTLSIALYLPIAATALFAVACGSSEPFNVPTVRSNPAPTVRLGEFASVELSPMTISQNAIGEDPDGMVLAKLNEMLVAKTQHLLTNWNNDPSVSRKHGTLLIQPMITELRYVTRGQRVWAGAMYGNSAIVIQVAFVDSMSGNHIADPVFFVRANAMSGSWGTQEDMMLDRVIVMISEYLHQNFSMAVGGPTGVE